MNSPERVEEYIEGSDCTGKDSVGEIIATEFGITNVQKLSLHDINPWDADRTKEIPSRHPLFPAYLLRSIIWDIEHFDRACNKRLQISFTASRSAAWCKASNDELGNVFQELLKFSPKFEHSHLLTASIPVKQERLIQRSSAGGTSSHIDKLVFTNPDFVSKMDTVLEDLVCNEMGAKKIDTDNYTIQEVSGIIIASINEHSVVIENGNQKPVQLDITPELNRFYREIEKYTRSILNKHHLSELEGEKLLSSLQSTRRRYG